MADKKIVLTEKSARKIGETVRKVDRITKDVTGRKANKLRIPTPQTMFAVRCFIDGGSGAVGDLTYTCESDAGFEYGTELTPEKCRYDATAYIEPDDGSWGYACFDKNGDFVLLEVLCEQPDCTEEP